MPVCLPAILRQAPQCNQEDTYPPTSRCPARGCACRAWPLMGTSRAAGHAFARGAGPQEGA